MSDPHSPLLTSEQIARHHQLAVSDRTNPYVEHGAWEPGEPLYSRPEGSMRHEQYIRELFSIVDDGGLESLTYRVTGLCLTCEVGWAITPEHPRDRCWICGGPNHRTHALEELF